MKRRSWDCDTRHGIVLVMVLVLASILLIISLGLLRVTGDDLGRLQNQMAKIQATYLAKGALSLAHLKARRFPSQLYDAISFRVGRNPFYPHANPNAYQGLLTSPLGSQPCPSVDTTSVNTLVISGPAFFTGTPGTPVWNRTGTDNVPGAPSNPFPALHGDYDGSGIQPRVTEYLSKFRADLCDANVVANMGIGSNHLSPQSSLKIPASAGDRFFGIPDPPVFSNGSFLVTDMASYGTNGGENSTDEMLRIQIKSHFELKYSGKALVFDQNEYFFTKITRQ
jgi:hypothetical protein